LGVAVGRQLWPSNNDLSATASSASPDRGIHGNGHMMMLEKNSDAIAGVVDGRLTTLPAKPAGRAAQR
jgi:hypothetical protein